MALFRDLRTLLLAFVLPPVAFAGLADPGGHTTFVHDNSSLKYSDFAGVEVGCATAPTSEACRNKWWVAENEGDFATVIQGMHSTAGPSASMSFTFTGSTVVWLRGRRDPDVELQSSVNGVSIARPVESTPATFSLLIDGLNPQSVNTFEVSYAAGSGILSVVVVFLDANGRAVDRPHDESPPSSTQSSTSELNTNESGSSIRQTSVTTVPTTTAETPSTSRIKSTTSLVTGAPSGDAPPQTRQAAGRDNSRRLVLIVSILATSLGLLVFAAGHFFWRRRRRHRQAEDFSPLFLSSPDDRDGSMSDPSSPAIVVAPQNRRSKQLLRSDRIQLQAIDMSPPSYESATATRNSSVLISDDQLEAGTHIPSSHVV